MLDVTGLPLKKAFKIKKIEQVEQFKWNVIFENETILVLTATPDEYYNSNGCINFKWSEFVWSEFVEAINKGAE